MPLPRTFDGPTYSAILARMSEAFVTVNGFDGLLPAIASARGSIVIPTVANGQAVAIIRAWRTAAGRVGRPWPLWLDLTTYALGRRPPERERFEVTPAWQDARLPGEASEFLWAALDQLASDLDAGRAAVRPLAVDWTRDAYVAAAREAWATMLAEAGAGAGPVTTPELDAQGTVTIPIPVPGRKPVEVDTDKLPKIPPEVVDEIADPGGIRRGARKVASIATGVLWAALLVGAVVLIERKAD